MVGAPGHDLLWLPGVRSQHQPVLVGTNGPALVAAEALAHYIGYAQYVLLPARTIFHGKKGGLRQRYHAGMDDQLSTLGLVVHTMVLWNTRYLQQALEQ